MQQFYTRTEAAWSRWLGSPRHFWTAQACFLGLIMVAFLSTFLVMRRGDGTHDGALVQLVTRVLVLQLYVVGVAILISDHRKAKRLLSQTTEAHD